MMVLGWHAESLGNQVTCFVGESTQEYKNYSCGESPLLSKEETILLENTALSLSLSLSPSSLPISSSLPFFFFLLFKRTMWLHHHAS